MRLPNPLAGLTVGRLMGPLKTFVGPRDLATRARALMRDLRVRALPVIEGGRLEGVVTQRSILRLTSTRSNIPVAGIMEPARILITPSMELSKAALLMAREGLDETPVVQSPTDRTAIGMLKIEDLLRLIVEALVEAPDVKVSDVMNRDVISCSPSDDLAQVWELMERENLSGLPVVEKAGGRLRVVGIVTRTDIIRSGGVRVAEESKKGRTPARVRSVMRTPVIVVESGAPLSRAAELMLTKRIKRLPVVESGGLVGIISRSDIVKTVCGAVG
jgi:CBS domain-containing protein